MTGIISVSGFTDELLSKIDASRGDVGRSACIRKVIEFVYDNYNVELQDNRITFTEKIK